jgi:hypothetical protein
MRQIYSNYRKKTPFYEKKCRLFPRKSRVLTGFFTPPSKLEGFNLSSPDLGKLFVSCVIIKKEDNPRCPIKNLEKLPFLLSHLL